MKSLRPLLMAGGVLVAAVAVGWFSLSRFSDNSPSPSTSGPMGATTMTHDHSMPGMDMGDGAMKEMLPLVTGADGTKASAGGLSLEPTHSVFGAEDQVRWQLRVTDRHGMVVTKFERDQTKLMHLIVVRSDLTGYQHLHPTLGPNGVFTILLTLPKAGTYRAIADFTTGGKRYALGAPITVPGRAADAPLPAPAMSATTDGYVVRVEHGAIDAGSDAQLDFTIMRNGKPVTALLPYLGAYAHLVALRNPTLAYSHVHPTSEKRSAGMVGFSAEFPQQGRYGLFLQFRTMSGVHTARFTISVG